MAIRLHTRAVMKPFLRLISLMTVFWINGCAVDVVAPPPSGVVIAVEDRPYYVHGPWYVVEGRRWVWVHGHWSHHHHRRAWVHGRYVRR
jgi:hypothetical protein